MSRQDPGAATGQTPFLLIDCECGDSEVLHALTAGVRRACSSSICKHRCRRFRPGPLICLGRAVDRYGAAEGQVCGERLERASVAVEPDGPSGAIGLRDESDAELLERARATGWSVGGPPCCPSCRRPDPAVARGLR